MSESDSSHLRDAMSDYDVLVSWTVDVDADCGLTWQQLDERLTSRSELHYGAVRGLPRIIDVLGEADIAATFYVPGEVAARYPELITALEPAGHEVGHHGYVHLHPDRVGETQQAEEFNRGLAALEELALHPRGYRCPGWELTPYTFELLIANGMEWDSSCMGDDRPYYEEHGGKRILELPVHWALDDWPLFGFTRDAGGNIAPPDHVEQMWFEEFLSALEEHRHMTITIHPEVMGRGHRSRMLARLIKRMRAEANVGFLRHGDIASRLASTGDTNPTDP